jgi:capsular polysaccharide biosynthesis protein
VFCSPQIYSSTVRIEVEKPNSDPYFMTTQCKIIESWQILTDVIADLDLNKKLPEQLGKKPWTMDDTYMYLVKIINVEQTRMTGLIEINVKNPSSLLAAQIANKIAYWYNEEKLNQWRELRGSSDSKLMPDNNFVIVRDPARPESKPVFPNPRIIIISISCGTLLALIAGGIAAGLGLISRASRASPSQAGG